MNHRAFPMLKRPIKLCSWPAPVPASFASLTAVLLLAFTTLSTPAIPAPVEPEARASSSSIPDRPEKLSFPPLVYEPPKPEDYRVALKAGPTAYVASDLEQRRQQD